MSFCKIFLHGNLVQDPELKQTNDGRAVCNFSVAVNGRNQNEKALFLDFCAYDKKGEIIMRDFRKSDPIIVGGLLRQDDWISKSGVEQSKMQGIVDYFDYPFRKRP